MINVEMRQTPRLFCYQVYWLTIMQIRAQYRGALSGFVITSLNPLLNYGMQSFVFFHILKIQMHNYLLFFAASLLPWLFIKQSLIISSSVFETCKEIIVTYHINPLAIVISRVIEAFITFIVSYMFILLLLGFNSSFSFIHFFIIPVSFFLLFMGIFSMAFLAAILNAIWRDVKFILPMFLSLSFWATPVFYPIHFVPEKFQLFFELNPFYIFVNLIRSTLYSYSSATYELAVMKVLIVNTIFILLTFIIWRQKRNDIFLRM